MSSYILFKLYLRYPYEHNKLSVLYLEPEQSAMINKYNFSLFAILLLLQTGCASVPENINIEASLDPHVKLSQYKTYTWLGKANLLNDPTKKWQPPNINVVDDIKSLIKEEMNKHGFIRSKEEQADLAVAFFVGVDMKAMRLEKAPRTRLEMLKNIPAAALVVSLIDTRTGYVIWVAKATADIQPDASEKVVRERLDYVISTMFEKLPMK